MGILNNLIERIRIIRKRVEILILIYSRFYINLVIVHSLIRINNNSNHNNNNSKVSYNNNNNRRDSFQLILTINLNKNQHYKSNN